jgi:hypothetical protein
VAAEDTLAAVAGQIVITEPPALMATAEVAQLHQPSAPYFEIRLLAGLVGSGQEGAIITTASLTDSAPTSAARYLANRSTGNLFAAVYPRHRRAARK